ncbi:hypothetical protein EZY14_002770 [Kordia sp. TARA_039_SRF]|nr:hypothetical protein EZY14_002770 [Kordia sp. TARA_039_SRF]
MNTQAYINEIQRGLWMVAPTQAYTYAKQAALSIQQASENTGVRAIEAASVMQVVDSAGRAVNTFEEEIPPDSVGIVRCIGSMQKYGSWRRWGTDELLEFMKAFDAHPNIVGQIWHDDSGGGTVGSVAPYLDFLKTRQKPVVSLVDNCASCNLWKNCNTDFLMAENDITAAFGSIGIMLTIYDYSKMYEEAGIIEHIIEADQSEDKNKSFKLALEGKYSEIKKEFLNPLAIKFQNYFKASRPNVKEVPGLLTGKMFYADEALEMGVCDGIGNLEAAIDKVKFIASTRTLISTF